MYIGLNLREERALTNTYIDTSKENNLTSLIFNVCRKIYILLYVYIRMVKKHLNLLIEADLIQKARDHGLIISKFLENKLQEYFTFIDAVRRGGDLNSCGAEAPRAFQARAVPV